MVNRTALGNFPIFFGSYLYPLWEPGNLRMAAVLSTMHATGTPRVTLEMMALQAGFIFFDMFTTAAAGSLTQPPTSTSILDYIYEQSFMTVSGVTIGPIYDANCSADVIAANTINRRCQCFKILKTVNVYDFRDWLVDTADHNPQFRWTMDGCGVEYSPLILPTTVNVALIVGIAVPCGVWHLLQRFTSLAFMDAETIERHQKMLPHHLLFKAPPPCGHAHLSRWARLSSCIMTVYEFSLLGTMGMK